MKESELKTDRHNRPIQKSELKTKNLDRSMKESELKMDRHNRPIQKSEHKTKKLDRSMKESELKMDPCNRPIQKSELYINRFYRPIQSKDRIGIGRSINRTFRPPLVSARKAITHWPRLCHIAIFPFQTLYRALITVFTGTLRVVVRARMAIILLATVMSHCNLSISNPLHSCNLPGGGES